MLKAAALREACRSPIRTRPRLVATCANARMAHMPAILAVGVPRLRLNIGPRSGIAKMAARVVLIRPVVAIDVAIRDLIVRGLAALR